MQSLSADRALLARVGTALYGDTWQSAIAANFGVNPRTVRRWAAGQNVIPRAIFERLGHALSERGHEIVALCAELSDALESGAG
jgi:hypothetical protein